MTAFSKADAKRAMPLLGKIIERRTTIPVLGNVMIKASGEALTFSGTDLDMEGSVAIPCSDTAPFAITIGARLLSGFIAGAGNIITLACDDKTATLESDGMAMTINLICPAEDMPVMNFASGDETVVSEALLHKALTYSFVAVSREETRYYLNGVYMHSYGGKLRAVATDGHRLSMYTTDQGWPFEGAIVPRKTVAVLLNGLKANGSNVVTVQQDGAKLRFSHPSWTLTSKVIDGTFPDYTRAIPKPETAFMATLSHAQINRIPRSRQRGAKLDPANGVLTIKDHNDNTVSVPMQGKGGPVGFNIEYLKDFTRLHGVVSLSGLGAGHPNIFKAEDTAWLGVLMPMRV